MASTIPANLVRQLCTSQEAALVRASRERSVKDASLATLREQRDRARALRDKFRDLAARQRREARGKQSPRGATASRSNDRTVLKAQLFAEVLENFEARIASISVRGDVREARSARSAGKTAIEVAKRAKRQAVRKGLRTEALPDGPAARASTGRGVRKAPGGSLAPKLAAKPKSSRAAASEGAKEGAKQASVKRSSSPTAKSRPKGKAAAPAKARATSVIDSGAVVRSLPAWSVGSGLPTAAMDPVTNRRNLSYATTSKTASLRATLRDGRTGSLKHLAHQAASGRRNQAKRDAANAPR